MASRIFRFLPSVAGIPNTKIMIFFYILENVNNKNSKAIEEITLSTNEMSQQVVQDSQSAQHMADMAQSQGDALAQYFVEE